MSGVLTSRWSKPLVFAASLLPVAQLAWGAYTQNLTANPIEYITRATGTWTLRFLLITLAISPARKLLRQPDLIRFRRMLGLFAFFYGFLHLITWVWLDKFFDPRGMLDDLTERRFITMGMAAFLLMVPLAVTSTTGWIRRLGKNWRRLHRLIYFSAVAGVIHYWWLVKSDIRLPLLYGVLLIAVLALRLVRERRAAH